MSRIIELSDRVLELADDGTSAARGGVIVRPLSGKPLLGEEADRVLEVMLAELCRMREEGKADEGESRGQIPPYHYPGEQPDP